MLSPESGTDIDFVSPFPKIRRIARRGQRKLEVIRYGSKKVRHAEEKRTRHNQFIQDLPRRQFDNVIERLETGEGTVEDFSYAYRQAEKFIEIPMEGELTVLCDRLSSGNYTNVDVLLAMKSCEQRFDHEGFNEVRQLIINPES